MVVAEEIIDVSYGAPFIFLSSILDTVTWINLKLFVEMFRKMFRRNFWKKFQKTLCKSFYKIDFPPQNVPSEAVFSHFQEGSLKFLSLI